MSPNLLPAERKDLPVLNTISVASKKHWGYPEEWIELWKDDLTISEADFTKFKIYKLVLETKIIGFCAMQESSDQYEIEHLWLLPSYIGQGFGKLLLEETLQRVVQKQKEIIVVADPYAEAFYARRGFRTFAQHPSSPSGRMLPVMRRQA